MTAGPHRSRELVMNEQRYMVFADMADKHTVVWARDNVITLGMSANDANELFARYTSEKLSGKRGFEYAELEMAEIVVSESKLTEAQKLVETIAQTHLAIVMSNDSAIAACDGSLYTISQTLFQTAIMAAYPHLPAGQIYQMWTVTTESIEYCASWFMKESEVTPVNEAGEWEDSLTHTHVHIQHDNTLREMIIPRYLYEQCYAMCGWEILGSMTAEDAHSLQSYKK